MILAPSSSSCCFCWNVMSQPSVSPPGDLINECWATRPDPLWGGHIWTLYIEIHICRSLFLFLPLSPLCFTLEILSSLCFIFFLWIWSSLAYPLPFLSAYTSFISSCCHSLITSSFPCFVLLSFPWPLSVFFLYPSLHLCITRFSVHPHLSSVETRPSCLSLYPRSPSPQLGVVPRSSPCLSLLGLGLCAWNLKA